MKRLAACLGAILVVAGRAKDLATWNAALEGVGLPAIEAPPAVSRAACGSGSSPDER